MIVAAGGGGGTWADESRLACPNVLTVPRLADYLVP